MIMYDGVNFISNIGGFKRCDLHLDMYVDNDYECACGEVHTFNYDSEILCQGAFKLILECPNNREYVTCVKLKSKFLGFGFSGFESLFGTKLSVINFDNFSEIDINSVDSNNMPKELNESLLLFHYIIKQEIGEI